MILISSYRVLNGDMRLAHQFHDHKSMFQNVSTNYAVIKITVTAIFFELLECHVFNSVEMITYKPWKGTFLVWLSVIDVRGHTVQLIFRITFVGHQNNQYRTDNCFFFLQSTLPNLSSPLTHAFHTLETFIIFHFRLMNTRMAFSLPCAAKD